MATDINVNSVSIDDLAVFIIVAGIFLIAIMTALAIIIARQ